MSDAEPAAGFPRLVAQAWADVEGARGSEKQHAALIGLVKAIVELTCDVVEAEYRDHRLASGPIEAVERVLRDQEKEANQKLGLVLQRALACWRHLGSTALLGGVPVGETKTRPNAMRFVATWEAIKLQLADLHGAEAQRACQFSLLSHLVKEAKAQSALTPFLEALVNCRNAHAHAEAFTLHGGKPAVPLGFGPRYFEVITPVLRAALLELLAELAPVFGAVELHRVLGTSEVRATGQFAHTTAE